MIPKQFLSTKEKAVTDSISGLCSANKRLNYLDGFPEIKVVVDEEFDGDKHVAIIAGGGAGHEPSFAGYVGEGMLAAAVVGDVFASPPTEAVLAAIKHVTGKQGCLITVINYTGDRLNFGLAVEQAKGLGYKVDMVIIGDDCALPGKGIAGRRGIAGAVLVLKIAGGAASQGWDLSRVQQAAQKASDSVGTLGVSTTVCTLPGGSVSDRLKEDEIEIGLGIHGEPGAEKLKRQPIGALVEQTIQTIVDFCNFDESEEQLAILVNNLGTATQLEMGIITGAVMDFMTKKRSFDISRVYSGTFMTSLDMHGFSVSIMKVTAELVALLDKRAQVPGWSNQDASFKCKTPIALKEEDLQAKSTRPSDLTGSGKLCEACLSAAAESICSNAKQLDDWDRRVGDGDCGSTMERGAEAIKQALAEAPLNDAAPLARCLAKCSASMGGTSGAIYNIFFTSAAANLPQEGPADLKQIAQAASTAVAAIRKYGGASPGHRTMLDALQPACEALMGATESGDNFQEAVQIASKAALKGAEQTKSMQAGAGRSSYVPDSELQGIPDPGAMAVAFWMKAISDTFADKL